MIGRLAWVTSTAARGRDDDESAGLAALRGLGVDVDVVDWDDARVDWARYDRVVPRSTWDYPAHLAPFLAWIDRVAGLTQLRNPAAAMRWNVDKRYLGELAAEGVATVPSTVVAPGDVPVLPAAGFVVKPTVGAGSLDVAAYRAGDDAGGHAAAREHVARIHARGTTALIQPLLASVARDGERALVFLDGSFSHAAVKHVALPGGGSLDDLFAVETITAHPAEDVELAAARAAVTAVERRFGPTTYARVDLVRDDDGRPLVLEVELIEPSLFLTTDPDAPERLAAALTR